MSNAMKKLKLLHHLTAASANATTSTGALPPTSCTQQQPTAPTPPPIPQTNLPSAKYNNNYAEMTQALRSARHALNMLNSPTTQAASQTLHHQPESFRASPYTLHHSTPKAPTCLLPQAFMVLTPNDPHPAICLPASPPPPSQPTFNHHNNNHYHHSSTLLTPIQINPPIQQVHLSEQAVPRGNTTIYSSRPPVAPAPSVVQYQAYQNSMRHRNSQKRPRLTTEAVSKIGKDSRLARWERVVGYVRDQRKTNPAAASESTSHSDLALFSTSGIIQEIERKNKILDLLDVEEQAARSLWSGGSGGTNGVDEFVWSEDEDDDDFRKDVENQAVLDEHRRRLDAMYPDEVAKEIIAEGAEVGVFELEDHDAEAAVKDFEMDIVEDNIKSRPRSSPIGTIEKVDGMKQYLEMLKTSGMPELKRESELEGGIDRLIARDIRRFSAVC
ncbi:hypothetical protein L873DRAFT_1830564 [Choiromyces venosus 120613-1]|uniref:Uncharacterized protein n=1 Tax=Choiromyces venosus 120613-1 TaxID=1336337 RepID=A0A3N4J9R9_9PEZI|nr:hypothetical protein L873DRAFT_1830564 [Choiromyces venosus 120613-1]